MQSSPHSLATSRVTDGRDITVDLVITALGRFRSAPLPGTDRWTSISACAAVPTRTSTPQEVSRSTSPTRRPGASIIGAMPRRSAFTQRPFLARTRGRTRTLPTLRPLQRTDPPAPLRRCWTYRPIRDDARPLYLSPRPHPRASGPARRSQRLGRRPRRDGSRAAPPHLDHADADSGIQPLDRYPLGVYGRVYERWQPPTPSRPRRTRHAALSSFPHASWRPHRYC